jgi:hypothetical protein
MAADHIRSAAGGRGGAVFRSFAIGLTPTPSVFLHLRGALVPVRVYMSGARTVHAVSPPPDSETHHEISDGIAEP